MIANGSPIPPHEQIISLLPSSLKRNKLNEYGKVEKPTATI
jgi:hypothetical protein